MVAGGLGRAESATRVAPLPLLARGERLAGCSEVGGEVIRCDVDGLEAALAERRIACACGVGRLAPWGWCEQRVVRMAVGERLVRPRRGICRGGCGRTHALLPWFMVARRRDGAEVILAALTAKAQGDGHRVIARRLGRPEGTVRGWLRRFAAISELVSGAATRWAYALDFGLRRIDPAGSPFANAVEALGVAMRAFTRRFGPTPPGPLAVRIAGGLLRRPPERWPPF